MKLDASFRPQSINVSIDVQDLKETIPVEQDAKVTASFQPQSINVSIDAPECDISTGTPIIRQTGEAETYDGNYVVTPSETVQILNTADKVLLNSIIVNPIPQNYGLITWNGTTLTVS